MSDGAYRFKAYSKTQILEAIACSVEFRLRTGGRCHEVSQVIVVSESTTASSIECFILQACSSSLFLASPFRPMNADRVKSGVL